MILRDEVLTLREFGVISPLTGITLGVDELCHQFNVVVIPWSLE